MFGLSAFFNALARLTSSVNTSADLFNAANQRMQNLLSIDCAGRRAGAREPRRGGRPQAERTQGVSHGILSHGRPPGRGIPTRCGEGRTLTLAGNAGNPAAGP